MGCFSEFISAPPRHHSAPSAGNPPTALAFVCRPSHYAQSSAKTRSTQTLLLSLTPDDLKDLGITLGGHRQRFSTPLRHFAPQCAPTHPLILYGYHSRLAKRWPPSRKRNARGQTATGLDKCAIALTGFRGCAAGFRPPLRVT